MNASNTETPPTDASPADDEVKNPAALLKRNRELIAELKASQAELKTAEDARQATLADAAQWRDRWYQVAVSAPLDAELRDAATVPLQYLKDIVFKHGLLKMEPDAEGVLRPRCYTVAGVADDAPHGGIAGHLSRVLNDMGLGTGWKEPWAAELCQATHQAKGTGALGSNPNRYPPRGPVAPPKQTNAPAAPLGLR